MTKAQALALMVALEGQAMPGSAIMAFPGGVETWSVSLDPTHSYSGVQLGLLASYCATNNLLLTAQFSALGVV